MQGNDLEIYQAANDMLTKQLRHETARADRIEEENDRIKQLLSGNARRLGLLARKHTPGETLTEAETGELAALQEVIAQVFPRTGPADLRAMQMEIERDKLAEIVTRNDGSVERSQALARELGEALTANAELVAVVRKYSRNDEGRCPDCGSYGECHAGCMFAAALAKHGGDERTTREARLSGQGFEENRFDPHTGARTEDDDER